MPFFHILLALLIVLVWGFNFVVIKIGLQDISPLFLVFIRFFLISFPAIFFIKKPQIPFKMLFSYGFFMFILQFSFLFTAIHTGMTPGLASLLLQAQVFFSLGWALLFFKERLGIWQIMGALLSFAGIAVVIMHLEGNLTLTGFLLIMGAAFSWSTGNVIFKKMGKVNPISLVIWTSLIAWPPLLIASLLLDGSDKIVYLLQHLHWKPCIAVFYITYLSTLFGYGGWNWLLFRHPLGTITPFTLIVPVFGMLSSVLVLGESLPSWKILAALCILLGLCLYIFKSKKGPPPMKIQD